jgi:hypothetical protein
LKSLIEPRKLNNFTTRPYLDLSKLFLAWAEVDKYPIDALGKL